jgi:DNA-binding transcriptional LysR family regulator
MLDLKRLRILREVSCRGSFSAAAESLYVSQSAVSQQVAALEAEVGVPLLLRLREGPVLTDAGRLLVSHADAAIARLDQAERELGELSGLRTGEVRMISFPSASATIATRAASTFAERHPDIRLSLAEGEPEDAIPRLKRGEFDLALVYDFELNPFMPDRDLDLRPLLTEEMHLAVPEGHRLSGRRSARIEELADEPWLCGASNGSCRELTIRSCERAGFTPDVSYESNDYNVIFGLVAAKLGVTLLPDLSFEAGLKPGVVILDVEPEPPVRRVWAATLTAGARSRAAEAMLDVLCAVSAPLGAQARIAA